MKITPEIKTKIHDLVKIIDYGMIPAMGWIDIRHLPEEQGEDGKCIYNQSIHDMTSPLSYIGFNYIYRDILGYTDEDIKKVFGREGDFEETISLSEQLHLDDEDTVYSKENLEIWITKYISEMVFSERRNVWHPKWE
jgi:hypothetical protein